MIGIIQMVSSIKMITINKDFVFKSMIDGHNIDTPEVDYIEYEELGNKLYCPHCKY